MLEENEDIGIEVEDNEDISEEDNDEENGGGLRDMSKERATKTINANKSAVKVFNKFCAYQRRSNVRHPLMII